MKTNILQSIKREKGKILSAPEKRAENFERYKKLDRIEMKIHRKYRFTIDW